jgi:hypothetical protein
VIISERVVLVLILESCFWVGDSAVLYREERVEDVEECCDADGRYGDAKVRNY